MLTDIDEDDIAADIRAAMGEEPAVEAPTSEVDPGAHEPEGGAGEQEETRARGPDGKFVAKPQEAAQDAPKPEDAPEPERTIRPPSSWSAAAKADFATLAPHIQQEVLRREREIEDGKAQWDTKAEKYNRLEAVIAPLRDRLALAGTDDVRYIASLAKADEMFRSDPMSALAEVQRLYGFSLPQAQQHVPQHQGHQQFQPDPVVQTLQRQLADLQERLEAQDNERVQQTQAEIDGDIEVFRQDPANLYFENVKPEMAALLQAGLADDLKEAYAKACHMRDDIRPLLSRAPAPAANGAQKTGVSVTGSPGQGQHASPANDPNRSIEDDVRAAMQELAGRV